MPFALDEVVSMKWSGVLGAGTLAKSMGAGRAKSPCEWVSRGRDGPIDPWFGAGGEGRLQALRVIDRRNGLLALKWVQHPGRAMAGGMQRERAAGSLAKMRGTTPHILRFVDNVKSGEPGCSAANAVSTGSLQLVTGLAKTKALWVIVIWVTTLREHQPRIWHGED